MSLEPGTRLGPYAIETPIGAGGMGEVYRARDTRLGRAVAIKVLPDRFATDPQFRDRFEREARAIAQLSHPNICTLHDIGEQDGRAFLVMEHLKGETLAARLRTGRVSYPMLLDWAVALADALSAAHAANILHRDLKPANVFIMNAGGIKILDFGLATSAREDVTGGVTLAGTQPGLTVGTIGYMSPEQARGERLDGRSDQFALGAVLYEAASGMPAFAGATSAVVFDAVMRHEVPVRRGMPPDVPSRFSDILVRLLAKRPADRFLDIDGVRLALRELKSGSDPGSRRSASAAVRLPSIAVLPFADMSAKKDQDYFCEGMAEELINALAKLPGLLVASRTSAFRFKGADDIRRIGEELRVEAVLEGSVRTAGSRLRVTAQLASVADGFHLWSDRFDRQMEDVFEIQDQIARAIVDALKVTLLCNADAPIVKPAAENVEAYQLCLRARHHWHRMTRAGFHDAAALFQKAIDVDPTCALAHFGLGDCFVAAGASGAAARDAIDKGRTLIETAIGLDPELAEAHAVLGIARGPCGWEWDAAERDFRRALTLNPRSAHAQSTYALHLMSTGRPDEAIRRAREAVHLDPLLWSWHMFEANVLYAARQYEKSLAAADLALSLSPSMWAAEMYGAMAAIELGRHDEALRRLERALDHDAPSLGYGWMAFALARAGRGVEAERKRAELVDRVDTMYLSPVLIACVSAALGDRDAGFEWLDRAVDRRDPQLGFHVGAYPALDPLRSDPRFADITRRIGL